EPAVFFCKFCTEFDRAVIYSEMHHAAFKREQNVIRLTVILVLLNGIGGESTCEGILQFHYDDKETVNENTQIEGELSSVRCVAELPCHAKNVLLIHLMLLLVIFCRGEIE
ncbi:MAG: hypothetical protein NC093_11405, partial [Alistipes sp.]|nr:hypothetical protein [Alistipes sp.]